MKNNPETARRYRELNKERLAAQRKEWKLRNPEKVAEYNKRSALKRKKPRIPPTYEEIELKKQLRKQRVRDYYQLNKGEIQSRRADYYQRNVLKQRMRAIQSRARKANIPYDDSVFDLEIPDTCPVLGIPIYPGSGLGGAINNSPSVDRIIPELGYVKGNMRIISNRANRLKNDMTWEEAQLIYKDMEMIHCEQME